MPFLHHHTHDDSQASPAGEPDDGRWRAKVLTVSDGVVAGTREDSSGAALVERLGEAGFHVVARQVTEDGIGPVAHSLRHLAEGFAGLVVTTGGTGFGPRDLTPEGTKRGHLARGAGPGRGHAGREPPRAPVAGRWPARSASR